MLKVNPIFGHTLTSFKFFLSILNKKMYNVYNIKMYNIYDCTKKDRF